MNERQIKLTASIGLFTGAIFGMTGSFTSSSSFRGFAWAFDSVSLIVASALLTVYYFRKGYDVVAAGFLVFAIGEGFILSCSGVNPGENISSFGAGAGLWSASLLLISFQKAFPLAIRCIGLIASVLFAVVSLLVFTGYPLNPLTEPLPFYAYPFLAATIFGWGWTLLRTKSLSPILINEIKNV